MGRSAFTGPPAPESPHRPRGRASDQTESEFQSAVIDLAQTFGWLVAHFRPARTAHGWRTPVTADGAGFPDLVLVHPGTHPGGGRVLFRELKADRGKITAQQAAWLSMLDAAGADACVWQPWEWPRIVAVLSFGRAQP